MPLMPTTYHCLPSNIKESDVVEYKSVSDKSGKTRLEQICVKQRLDELGAHCSAGKLVDRKGREIKFYFLQGCWGNPPTDYQKILGAQTREIKQLKKDHTVIEMTCQKEGPIVMRPF